MALNQDQMWQVMRSIYELEGDEPIVTIHTDNGDIVGKITSLPKGSVCIDGTEVPMEVVKAIS